MFASLLLLPSWVKAAIVGGILIGAMQIQHMVQMHGLRNQITALTLKLADSDRVIGELRQGLATVQANRDELRATIVSQNAAIDLWQSRAKTAEAKAATKAVQIVSKGSAAAAVLRNTTGSIGPEGLNTWLSARFSAQ